MDLLNQVKVLITSWFPSQKSVHCLNIKFLKISAHLNMFWQHYLKNRKTIFLACFPEQVYAAILESLKNNVFFRSTKPNLAGSLKLLWHDFRKTTTARKKQTQTYGNHATELSTFGHAITKQHRKRTFDFTEIVNNFGLTQGSVCQIMRFIFHYSLKL